MSNIEEYTEKTFKSIKHIDEYGNEYLCCFNSTTCFHTFILYYKDNFY